MKFPEFKPNISTCRSPQQMFSAILKDYYRDEANAQGKKTYVVSIKPCTAKKMEAERPDAYTYGEKDTDIVLTTSELIRMIDAHGVNFETMPSEACDMPFGIGSGAGVIFGATGGVTEAVLRRLVAGRDAATLNAIAECGVRGDGIKEFSIPYNGIDVKICVASGLANARQVLESVKSGEKEFHFIEIMACPGGCVMGGGQPVGNSSKVQRAEFRTKGLYAADGDMIIKKSNENPPMDVFYSGPMKDKIHDLLHNHHE